MGAVFEDSVYNLINSLCEKITRNQDVVKRLRSKAFCILLNKAAQTTICSSGNNSLDPLSKLMVWKYTLVTEYGLENEACDLLEYAKAVKDSYGDDIIQLLVSLRNVPTIIEDSEDIDFHRSLCQLLQKNVPNPTNQFVALSEIENEEEPNVWELAAKETFNNRKTWDNFGHPEPEKAKKFLSELGTLSNLWVKSLPSVYCSCMQLNQPALVPRMKAVLEFITDLKFLLVGMASDSFIYNKEGDFILVPDVTVSGVSLSMVQLYSRDFIVCGNCYKALQEFSTANPQTETYKQSGYIFAELCQSIQRYMEYFRSTVMHLPGNIGLARLQGRTESIRKQIMVLACICKVGPYEQSNDLLYGVSLLNYLYETVLNITDQKILAVLYSILFPCCQVYFSRFLQQWLLDGTINDPFDEFFIKPNQKYINSRGRTCWTFSYELKEKFVPIFLKQFQEDILTCGKTMNMLKLHVPSNKLCWHLSGKKPHIISCCFSSEQLALVEQNTMRYYLEMLSECGPVPKLDEIIRNDKETDPIFMNLIARKRALTLQKLELERRTKLIEEREKKMEEVTYLKDQYDAAIKLKESRFALELDSEIKHIEYNLTIEAMRDKLIEKEAKEMVHYYQELYDISQRRLQKIEKHIENLKTNLDDTNVPLELNSSQESFYSTKNEDQNNEIENKTDILHSSNSLDRLNANEDSKEHTENANIIETIEIEEIVVPQITVEVPRKETLTDAQRNKLRVMNSEFAMGVVSFGNKTTKRNPTQMEINRNLVMNTNACFYGDYKTTTERANLKEEEIKTDAVKIKKSVSLCLDIQKQEDQPVPMSVDSTPMSESTTIRTPFSIDFESIPNTAETKEVEDNDFMFESPQPCKYLPIKHISSSNQMKVFSQRVTKEEAANVKNTCLKTFVSEGVSIPVLAITRLVNSELLKYFINDLKYFDHLESLRDYFFLQDGEFGRNITEKLFEKLYHVQFPSELINGPILNELVFGALQMSNKNQDQAKSLSFKITSVPKRLDLGDPDVLDCLSLSYKVQWPLNILLPPATLSKYDTVFKFLLKLNRISWALKKMLMDLKILAKISGRRENYLIMSPHYRKVQQCRHVMLHFVQTLQNYIVGEVLQGSWELFRRNLESVLDIDSLYRVHTLYIKNILFLCLLNQKSSPLMNVIQKIFLVILKFFDYLRSRQWECKGGAYIHPNFKKLEIIFNNFEDLLLFLIKAGRKVAQTGYQPQLTQLLDMIDTNGYYSNKINALIT